jgi:alcohol dehydrogenase class IV
MRAEQGVCTQKRGGTALAGNEATLRKFVAPEFVFGSGALELVGQYVANMGGRKVLLVTDENLLKLSWAHKVGASLEQAGLPHEMFCDVSPNPRDHEIMEGAQFAMQHGCDCIVAVGGGSVLDAAKGIGIVVANGRHILAFEGVDNVPRPGAPLICIPTTAGSSADVSQFCIVNDTQNQVKIAIVSKTMVPDAALIDPQTTVSMDRGLTAHTGLDALTHAMEAYVSNASSPMTDLHALEAVRLISASLGKAIDEPHEIAHREKMMLGSLYAGLAFSNAILGAVHSMAHSLGGFLDLPHGLCNALLLEHVVMYNFHAAAQRYTDIGRAMGARIPEGEDEEAVRGTVVRAIREFKERVGVRGGLRDLGVRPEDIEALAEKAVNDPCLLTNPEKADVDDIANIYQRAL